MPAAELIVHTALLTIGIFAAAALVSTAKEKWLPSRKEKKPQNRKENQSMTNNTSVPRSKEEITARLKQVSSELAIFKQVNAPQSSIDLMQARVDELTWILQEAN